MTSLSRRSLHALATDPVPGDPDWLPEGTWRISAIPIWIDPAYNFQLTWYPVEPCVTLGCASGTRIAKGLSLLGALGLGWYVHKKTSSVPKAALGATVGAFAGPIVISTINHFREPG
jgi:hypothetical protein